MPNLIQKKIQMLQITNTEIWSSHQQQRLIKNKTKGKKPSYSGGGGILKAKPQLPRTLDTDWKPT